jgi:hypothetical protein
LRLIAEPATLTTTVRPAAAPRSRRPSREMRATEFGKGSGGCVCRTATWRILRFQLSRLVPMK